MNYIRTFNDSSEQQAIYGKKDSGYIEPWLDYVKQINEVHFNAPKHDYSKDYLTIISLSDGAEFFFSPVDESNLSAEYSKDGGQTWNPAATAQNYFVLDNGESAILRGYYTPGIDPESNPGIGTLNGISGSFEVCGNAYSMLSGDSFSQVDEVPACGLYGLFRNNSYLVSAENLSLPAMTMNTHCYHSMFEFCTNLTKGPVLPAEELIGWCYSSMFYGCSSLNYIKAMFTDAPQMMTTGQWVYGVPGNGTFVKNANATWTDTFGDNAIPNGWTVETA